MAEGKELEISEKKKVDPLTFFNSHIDCASIYHAQIMIKKYICISASLNKNEQTKIALTEFHL